MFGERFGLRNDAEILYLLGEYYRILGHTDHLPEMFHFARERFEKITSIGNLELSIEALRYKALAFWSLGELNVDRQRNCTEALERGKKLNDAEITIGAKKCLSAINGS